MAEQFYYERNRELMESPVNKTFEEILWMTTDEFRAWCIELRKVVVYLWDEKGLPPRMGFDKQEIIEQFQKMEAVNVQQYEKVDEVTGKHDIIRCTTNLGNAVNQFFPTMFKTKINYSHNLAIGRSIYDWFQQPQLLEPFITYATRHFKRDGFYNYSLSVKAMQQEHQGVLPVERTAVEWIVAFEYEHWRDRGNYDYWLAPMKDDEYTGFKEELKTTQSIRLTRKDIETLVADKMIPAPCMTNVDFEKSESYAIRTFQKGQKLFPIGLKAFRVSFSQYAVQFPPLVAKYVYEKYTEPWKYEKSIYVWDPSAGWGGRLLGALAVEDSRHLTYLGNDPNTDHNTTPGRTKYHEVYDFYCEHVRKGGMWGLDHNHFQFWQLGSEDMQHDRLFKRFRGKLSLVFTSPPYFAKERYSDDATQSCNKFSGYDAWRDGFLIPTLKTAVEWLRPGGYLAWNVADVEFGSEVLPLEEDSRKYLESAGMQYVETVKMALSQMPGSHRICEETGLPKTRNYCRDGKHYLKYEPIIVYQKPL